MKEDGDHITSKAQLTTLYSVREKIVWRIKKTRKAEDNFRKKGTRRKKRCWFGRAMR